jgi:hypothetical protein
MWVNRHHKQSWFLWSLGALMFLVLFVTVRRIERLRTVNEPVWDTRAVAWSKLPLKVFIDAKAFTAYLQTFNLAMDTWNKRVGCTVFVSETGPEHAQVLIRSADGSTCGTETFEVSMVTEPENAPVSAWYCNGYVDIQMRRLDRTDVAFRIVLHELGHSIGLTHDDRGAMSVMVFEPQTGDAPEYLLPSDKDVAAIKERYCR